MVTIVSNYHWRETDYGKPDWSDDEEECFCYRGEVYFLSEFMAIHNRLYNPNPPDWMLDWDGYSSDSFFSGILIRYQSDDHMSDDWWPEREDCIQVATYIG